MYIPLWIWRVYFWIEWLNLAGAHHASSARTTRCSYIRERSRGQTSRLVLMWTQKKGCVHRVPSPRFIHRNCINPSSLRRFQSPFNPRRWEALGSAAHQSHFSASYQPVIYRARTNIQWKEGSGLSSRQVKPQEHLSFQRHLLLGMPRIHSRGVGASLVVRELAGYSQNRAGEGGGEEPSPSPIPRITEYSARSQSHLTGWPGPGWSRCAGPRKGSEVWEEKRQWSYSEETWFLVLFIEILRSTSFQIM